MIRVYKEVAVILRQHIQNYDFMLHLAAEAFKMPASEKLFFGGKANILSQPDFHDLAIDSEPDEHDRTRRQGL